MRIYARLTSRGTPAFESAVCQLHFSHSIAPADAQGEPVDCTSDTSLSCQVCGATSSVRMEAVDAEAYVITEMIRAASATWVRQDHDPMVEEEYFKGQVDAIHAYMLMQAGHVSPLDAAEARQTVESLLHERALRMRLMSTTLRSAGITFEEFIDGMIDDLESGKG